jgi:hypothetical protein
MLNFSGYNCDQRTFQFDIFARHGVAYLDRDEAVAAALNIVAVAALFGGLLGTECERLNQIIPRNRNPVETL